MKNNRFYCLLAAAVSVAILSGASAWAEEPEATEPKATTKASPKISFEEKLLATAPEGVGDVYTNSDKIATDLMMPAVVFSPNGYRVMCSFKRDGKEMVFLDGKVQPGSFGCVVDMYFSPDSQRVAWRAYMDVKVVTAHLSTFQTYNELEMKDGVVFIDGKEVQNKIASFTPPKFSPDGKHYVIGIAIAEGNCFYLIDGKSTESSAEGCYDITFSPNSKRVGYVIPKKKSKKKGENIFEFSLIVEELNGSEKKQTLGKGYNIIFSPDGKRLAYVTKEGNEKESVVIDRKKSRVYSNVSYIWGPLFSPNSKRVAYSVSFFEGDSIVGGILIVDGKVLAEAGKEDNLRFDGYIIFSPDSKRIAYGAGKRNTKSFEKANYIIVDGKAGPKYHDVSIPVFSPDSKRLAYWVEAASRRETGFDYDSYGISVDGKVGPTFEIVGRTPVFSPDSKLVAYKAKDFGKWHIVLGEKKSKEAFDFVTDPIFSPDSKKIAFGARKGRELWWKVYDIENFPEEKPSAKTKK